MKNITKFILALVLAIPGFAQTTTPSTTLCAAITSVQTNNICLTSTTGIVNQAGLYVDNEYMTVNLANGQTLAASNAYVPVTRNNRAGNGPPSNHSNGAKVWVALMVGSSVNPGANGFVVGTQLGDYGPCTRTSITYLPHIWPDRGVIRDCNSALGYWVDYVTGPVGNFTSAPQGQPSLIAANGAIDSHTQAQYLITKAGVAAMTLAAPTATTDDFKTITISSGTANAHTITVTAGVFYNGKSTYAADTVATFAAFPGASITLMAYQGHWVVVSTNGSTVTFT